MTSIYCSKGHENPLGSLFCRMCGEKLSSGSNIYQGMILGSRYRVIRELGHGGFGRTYLAEDINRFSEPCVLKEYAPAVQGTYALQKAEELFEREAGVLYKLQHPQIPKFRELFRANFGNKGHLFLVQDYVEGQTYHRLLDARKQQGSRFTEAEVLQLLVQLLPVLQYIHNCGVIHRDISPDNLMLRTSDQLPVLIDFGGVKQVAATVEFQLTQSGDAAPSAATRLGKVGYAPGEQMQLGTAAPHSDLYALGVTLLVLLTGKEPQEMVDQHTLAWHWRREVRLGPILSALLDRMLAQRVSDRYQSATEVMQALNLAPSAPISTLTQPPVNYNPPPPKTQATLAVAPAARSLAATPTYSTSLPVATRQRKPSGLGRILLLFLLVGVAGVGWGTHDRWLPLIGNHSGVEQPDQGDQAVEPGSDTSSQFPPEEQARKAALRDRRQALGVDYQFLIDLTNTTFYSRYPDQQGRTLSNGPEDAEWRSRWDATATELLDILEANLSGEARSKLGNYTETDREQWKNQVNQLNLGTRALYDLTDAKFLHLFPERQGEDFINRPIGQVWQAIALDQLRNLQSGSTLERVRFEPNAYSKQVSGTLQPGEGKAHIAGLSEGQLLRLNLQAPNQATQLSIYLPRPTQDNPFVLEDSSDVTWSGKLTQTGFYEFVVVSRASEPVDYQLNLAVDNITSTPAPEPTESPSTESDTEPSIKN